MNIVPRSSGGPGLPATTKPVSAASKDIFLLRYREGDSVSDALDKAGMSRAQLKYALAEDPRFRLAHAEVEERLLDQLEGVAHDLAHKRDGSMVRWLLERLRPEKYGPQSQVVVTHRFQSAEEIRSLTDEDLLTTCREFGIVDESEA
jgi:hypothetical protein